MEASSDVDPGEDSVEDESCDSTAEHSRDTESALDDGIPGGSGERSLSASSPRVGVEAALMEESSSPASSPMSTKGLSSMFRKIPTPSKASDKGAKEVKEKEPKPKARLHRRTKSLKALLLRGGAIDSSKDQKEKDKDQHQHSQPPSTPTHHNLASSNPTTPSTPNISGTTARRDSSGPPPQHNSGEVPPAGAALGGVDQQCEEAEDMADLVPGGADALHPMGDEPELLGGAGQRPEGSAGMSWSDFEDRYCGPDLQNDPLAAHFLFPDDDVSVLAEPRAQRTSVSTVPSELLERGTECHGLDGWLRACVESFTSPWTVVRYNYAPTALEPGTTTNLSSGVTMTSPMPLVSSTNPTAGRLFHTSGSTIVHPTIAPRGPAASPATAASSSPTAVTSSPGSVVPHPTITHRYSAPSSGSSIVNPSAPRVSLNPLFAGRSDTELLLHDRKLSRMESQEDAEKTTLDEAVCEGRTDDDHLRSFVEKLHDQVADDTSASSPHTPKERPASTSSSASSLPAPPHNPFTPPVATKLLVSCERLQWQAGEAWEPLFCSAALYHLGTKRRISETFYFDHNNEAVLKAIAKASGTAVDSDTQANKALFTVVAPSPLIHLVVRVERPLLTELDKEQETFYYKPKHWKPRDPAKAQQELLQAIEQWAAASGGRPPPLQVLGWGALPVFAENGVLRASGRLRVDPLLPARGIVDEEALFEALAGLSSSAEKAAERAASGGRKRSEASGSSGGGAAGAAGGSMAVGGGSKRSLSGCLHVTLQRIQDEDTLPHRLDPGFHPLLPFADNPRPDVSQLIREVMSFEGGQREAYTSYVNWIYVYPEGVHLAKGGPSSPNLLVEARLKDDDDVGGGRALPVMCGRSGSGRWHEVSAASMHMHERKPRYWDELKVRLPARLTPRHHLLFTFLHVHPGHRKDSATVIGHAVLPLFTNHCVVPNGRQALPITWARDFPAAYLALGPALRPRSFSQHSTASSVVGGSGGSSGSSQQRSSASASSAGGKEADKQHPAFIVSTHVVSSVYPPDEPLCRFFELVRPRPSTVAAGVGAGGADSGEAATSAGGDDVGRPPQTSRSVAAEERKVTMASWNFALDQTESDILRGLSKLDALTCVHYMPVLLNELFYLMASHDQPKRRKEAFLALIHLVRAIEKGTGTRADHNALLTSYVRYMFRNPDRAPYLLYEELCHHWLLLLSRRHEALEGFTGNRFLLDVLTKSMTLHVHSSPRLRKSQNRKMRFSAQFTCGLARLVRFLFSDRAVQSLDALSNFPILLRKLFAVMDRGLVLNMVYEYVRGMKDQHAILGKFKFLQILMDYEHYIPLNLPVIRPIESLDLGQLLDQWWQQHFLAGLLLKQIDMSRDEPPALRTQAIITLRNILKKHEHDERYQRPALRERVANLYFPFVVLTAERADQLDEREKGEWLACFLHIARHCSRSLLRSWWQRDTQKRQVAFLRLLASCVSAAEGDSSLDAWTTAFEFVIDYMQDFRSELRTPGNVLLTRVFAVLHQLMQHAQPSLLPALYAALQSFICQFRASLFRHTGHSRLCETLSFEILRHANAPEALTRRNAASTFYVLLKNNWDEMGNIARMRVQSTVAVSRLIGGAKAGQGVVDTTRLQTSLRAVGNYSKLRSAAADARDGGNDTTNNGGGGGGGGGGGETAFDAGVQELISRIFRLCHYSVKIADNIGDPETTADFYRRISEDYFDSPDLRARWLENLAEFHTNHSKLEEAAQCKLHAAALVAQYLRRFKRLDVVSDADFASISPNVSRDLRLPEAGEIDEQAAFQDQDVWSTSGLTKLLKAAANLLEQAKSHELCVEVLMLLTTIYKAEKKYPELISTLELFKAMTTTLVNANKFDVRIFPVYFRVGFYGPKAEELQGKEFIYKVPGETRLGHIQAHLKEKHAKKVGGVLDDVLILQNKPMEAEKMDPSKLYIQLGPVTPHSDPLDSTPRISPHEVNFNVNTFVLETGFSESGKNVTELAKQQKKKVVFTVSFAFPYQTSRLEVERTSELILSPLENAIELIENRVAALRAQLTQNPPRLNALQSVIQGSVVTMVNEGPLRICEVFLAPGAGDGEGQQHEPHRIVVLKERMTDFVKLCGFAIKLNKSLISSEHLPFQAMVEQKYEALREAIRVYTDV